MEAEFGQYFLSAYHHAPLRLSVDQAAAPAAPACQLPVAPTGSPPGPFRLAPPPQPTARLSVCSPISHDQVVVVDSLTEVKASDNMGTFCAEEDELIVTGAVPDDDEASLLGDDAVKPDEYPCRLTDRVRGDGIDSDSDSNDDDYRPRNSPETHIDTGSINGQQPSRTTESETASIAAMKATEPTQSDDVTTTGVVASAPQSGKTVSVVQHQSPPENTSDAQQHLSPMGSKKADVQVATNLDKFFNDEHVWQRVANEVVTSNNRKCQSAVEEQSGSRLWFRVQVPKPYPGVQYRKSKNLDDKYAAYARSDTKVQGTVENGGEWLRISDTEFLPMRVGTIQILTPLPREVAGNGNKSQGQKTRNDDRPPPWWACPCKESHTVAASPGSEVVVDDGDPNLIKTVPVNSN